MSRGSQHSILALLVVAMAMSALVGAVSNEPYQGIVKTKHTAVQPFVHSTLPAQGNDYVYGITIQTAYPDCTYGSHWSLVPSSSQPASTDLLNKRQVFSGTGMDSLHNSTYDATVCALFVYPSTPGQKDLIRTFNLALRSAVLTISTEPNALEPASVSIRVGWVYWLENRFIVGSASPQRSYYCQTPYLTSQPTVVSDLVNIHDARAACKKFNEPVGGFEYDTGVVASPYSGAFDRLLRHLRTSYGRRSSLSTGYTTWTGYTGEGAWADGEALSYSHFLSGDPKVGVPAFMDNYGNWHSENPVSLHSYCCESTGFGPVSAWTSGLNRVTLEPEHSPKQREINVTFSYDGTDFYPIKHAESVAPTTQGNALLLSGTDIKVFGATVAVDQEDCHSSIRLILSEAQAQAIHSNLTVNHDVEVCHLFIATRATTSLQSNGMTAFHPAPYIAVDYVTALLRQIQLRMISDSLRPNGPLGTPGKPIHLIWQYWLQNNLKIYLNHHPIVHSYQCHIAGVEFEEAGRKCGEWGLESSAEAPTSAQKPEGYVVTITTQPEQALVAHFRPVYLLASSTWIGLRGGDLSTWTNGDGMGNYLGWAPNEPQHTTGNAPTLLSSTDSLWHTLPDGVMSFNSVCCERSAIPERGDTGTVSMTPLNSDPSDQQIKLRWTYDAGLPNFPFAKIRNYVSAATKTKSVNGVTIQADYSVCQDSTAIWKLVPLTLTARIVVCPPLSGLLHDPTCTTSTLLKGKCTLHIYRDDQLPVQAEIFLEVMERLQFTLPAKTVVTGNTSHLEPASLLPEDPLVYIGWSMWLSSFENSVLDPRSGHEYWCNKTHIQQNAVDSFSDAMSQCHSWEGIGYLPTLQSEWENFGLLDYARNVADNFATGQARPAVDVWLGHKQQEATWLNGDLMNYTLWQSGQPSTEGPTISLGSDAFWKNINALHSSTSSVGKAVCCERSAFTNSLGMAGLATFGGQTLSASRTSSAYGFTESKGRTTSPAETTEIPYITPEVTASHTITVSETDAEFTNSLEITQSINDFTASRELSQSLEVTTSHSITPLFKPVPYLAFVGPKNGVITVESIRGQNPATSSASWRTVTIQCFNTRFRHATEQQVLFDSIKFQSASEKKFRFGFDSRKSTLISVAPPSFSMNAFILNITLQIDPLLDIPENEPVSIIVPRSLTYAEARDGVGIEYDSLQITLQRTDQPSAIAQAGIIVSTAIACIGSPSAFKDAQAMALFGAMTCARGESRTFYYASYRILSPLTGGDALEGPWLGSFLPSYFIALIHCALLLGVVVFGPGPPVKAGVLFKEKKEEEAEEASDPLTGTPTPTPPPPLTTAVSGSEGTAPAAPRQVDTLHRLDYDVVEDKLIKLRFPSASLFFVQLLHMGVTYYSIELLKVVPTFGWTLLAAWGIVFSFVLTVLLTYWSVRFTDLTFSEYTSEELVNVPKVLRFFVPYGRWGTDGARRMCRWVIGDFHYQLYASAEYWVGGVVALLAAYMPDSLDWCVAQYVVQAVFFFLMAVLLAYFRPYRSLYNNVAAVVTQLLLSGMAVCGATLVNEPLGAGNDAAIVIRWIVTGIVFFRGLVGLLVMLLETKLVDNRVAALKEQKEARDRSKKILQIVDSQTNESDMTLLGDDPIKKQNEELAAAFTAGDPYLMDSSPPKAGGRLTDPGPLFAESSGVTSVLQRLQHPRGTGGGLYESPLSMGSGHKGRQQLEQHLLSREMKEMPPLPKGSKLTSTDDHAMSGILPPINRSIYSPDPRAVAQSLSLAAVAGASPSRAESQKALGQAEKRRRQQLMLSILDDEGPSPSKSKKRSQSDSRSNYHKSSLEDDDDIIL